MNWIESLQSHHPVAGAILSLSLVAVVGLGLGNVRVKGVGLGAAGVLFAGIVFLGVLPLLLFLRAPDATPASGPVHVEIE